MTAVDAGTNAIPTPLATRPTATSVVLTSCTIRGLNPASAQRAA
jgi:hypothetical protein